MRSMGNMAIAAAAAAMLPAGLSAAAVAPGGSLDAAAQAPAAVVDAFHSALQSGDVKAAGAAIAPDALIFESGAVERGAAEYAGHHLPADAAFAKATKRTVSRRSGVAHGDMAWITTEGTTTGSYKGKAINSRSLETMVLRREGGAWRIVHIHWSSANVK